MNEHLVSRVLLRRFSNHPRGPITALDLVTRESRTGRVEAFGGVEGLLRRPIPLEQRWNSEVEMRLPHAFKVLGEGTLLDDSSAVETIKKCLVLHTARSQMVLWVTQRTQGVFAAQVTDKTLEAFDAVSVARALTGLTLSPEAAAALVPDRVADLFDEYLREDDFLATLFDRLYETGQERVSPLVLEVLEADEDEFLLSDSPVSFWDRDLDRVGFAQGVGWGSANSVFMPLGPKHVVGLSTTSGWRNIDRRMVETINSIQVRGSFREIYVRPESGLDLIIAHHLAA
jgi:hypothetical protein